MSEDVSKYCEGIQRPVNTEPHREELLNRIRNLELEIKELKLTNKLLKIALIDILSESVSMEGDNSSLHVILLESLK